jgi:hypothetical protein
MIRRLERILKDKHCALETDIQLSDYNHALTGKIKLPDEMGGGFLVVNARIVTEEKS